MQLVKIKKSERSHVGTLHGRQFPALAFIAKVQIRLGASEAGSERSFRRQTKVYDDCRASLTHENGEQELFVHMSLKFWNDRKTNNLDNIDYPALKLACSRAGEAQANDAPEE